MKSVRICFLFFILIFIFSFKSERKHNRVSHWLASDTFPIPPPDDNLLFYVQRTPNTNTIVYELNLNRDGTLNKEEPVHIFWIRYKEDGSKEELSYLQRKYAYGLHSTLVDADKLFFKLHFVSYSKRHLYLQKSPLDKKYHIFTNISGKWSVLDRIFVKIEGGSFWLPNIRQVEMYGKEHGTGKATTEAFNP